MRTWKLSLLMAIAALCVPATASAAFAHVVSPGESLSSVAAADGLSVGQLAAANGLSPDAQLTAGTSLAIPPQSGEAGVTNVTPPDSPEPAETTSSVTETSSTGGGYVVQPGDTLSAIAARYGVSVDALASVNGLDAAGILPAGDTLSVGGSSSTTETVSTTSPVSASGGAQATVESVSPSSVGSIAAAAGVSPSLAMAIADQESGFSNNAVSTTGATGVMQIEPGTWNYIQSLGGPALASGSATDNIRGGVQLLRSLLDQTGGDAALAAAGYYQGLASVRANGMYPDTQRYVNNVMALRAHFGGP